MTSIPIVKTLIRSVHIILILGLSYSVNSQKLTGSTLLEKAIAYHDPNGNWNTLKAELTIKMNMPESAERITKIQLDFPNQFYSSTVTKDVNTITSTLKKDDCTLILNGSTDIPKAAQDSLRISCDRAKMMRDYYTYLYGLPMKLNDPGTNIYEKVQKKIFMNKEYLVLKADYDQAVGRDTWYFYFDPTTYAMEVYQFFKDEPKNDGEYILLTEIMEVNDIKIPKTRAWYYNKDDSYLATDILTKAIPLN